LKPAAAAAAKRCGNGTSLNIIDRLAANLGMGVSGVDSLNVE
jgi:hypothetical protein